MKIKFLIFSGALLLMLSVLPFLRTSPAGINWKTQADSAFKQARSEEKLLMTFLYTDWCTYCRQMDQTTFQDSNVISQLGQEFVWLRLNPERDEQGELFRRRYRIEGYPTLLILNAEGEEIDRVPGFVPADRFIQMVDRKVAAAAHDIS